MPRPTRSQGRPGTRVFPAHWAADHGTVMAKTWPATCVIHSPRAAGDDYVIAPDLAITEVATPDPLYAGACRVQQLNAQETRALIGNQEQVTVGYLVVIDRAADIPLKAVIDVSDVDDPALLGRRLVVRKVGKGTDVWERDLYAVEDQTAAPTPSEEA